VAVFAVHLHYRRTVGNADRHNWALKAMKHFRLLIRCVTLEFSLVDNS